MSYNLYDNKGRKIGTAEEANPLGDIIGIFLYLLLFVVALGIFTAPPLLSYSLGRYGWRKTNRWLRLFGIVVLISW